MLLRLRQALCACLAAHKVIFSQNLSLTAAKSVIFFFLHSFNFTAEGKRQHCLLGTKHIGKIKRVVLNETSSYNP